MKSIFILLLIFTGLLMSCSQEAYQPSKGEQLANAILATTAKVIKEKYNIKPCGKGVAMPGGPIQKLTLCFNTSYPHTKDQLRELLLKSAEELIDQVNGNEEIQYFLKDRPFSIQNVQIIIYNHDENGRSLRDPQISNAQIVERVLTYSTIDVEDSFKYKNEFEESYEEALKANQSHNSHD